jgi:cystathionine beta-lyase/cystathionine gamma-synthase
VSRPAESRAFTPRTRPVVPPIHHLRAARIDDGMIRLSVGPEDPAELIADLASALEGTR